MPEQDFGNDLNFQSFETAPSQQYGQSIYGENPYLNLSSGEYGQGSAYVSDSKGFSANEFDDEPPLLEELGINPDFIIQKVEFYFFSRFFLTSFLLYQILLLK
ncbi:hypothetical protein RN001_002823 [Aquatica leii]|uniref:Uncharacterized protein n=1 Tax=Aquatica leii TaxID=1421715 RepID=A0AAN7Q8Z4_9COLE|nr:hypothetical protein RN001_002823 [Aquatica leii]